MKQNLFYLLFFKRYFDAFPSVTFSSSIAQMAFYTYHAVSAKGKEKSEFQGNSVENLQAGNPAIQWGLLESAIEMTLSPRCIQVLLPA